MTQFASIQSSHAFELDVAHGTSTTTTRLEGKTMALTMDQRRKTHSKFKRTESIEFRLIFAAAFVVFLAAAIVERLVPRRFFARVRPAGERKSIFEQAKGAANTCAAYAFMG
jgi:hypothetical protein